MRLRFVFAPALLLSLASAVPAHAAVPSPQTSSVDACLTVCPYGDIAFRVVVRDAASNPVANSMVFIDPTACTPHPAHPSDPPLHLCPSRTSDDYQISPQGWAYKFTDITGTAVFHLHAGGVCPDAGVRIYADGVLLAQRGAASPDQNGSLVVTSVPDATLLVAKQGAPGYDVTADFDCDLFTNNDADDFAIYDAHSGHACDVVTPARRPSWGALKITYR